MKVAFLAAHTAEFAVRVMCQTLQVAPSGYDAWLRRAPSPHAQADAALAAQIQTVFVAGRGVYGSPRVHAALHRQGTRCRRKRVARRMRAQSLCAVRPHRQKPRTIDSQHHQPVAPNLLGRHFTAAAPNRRWVADITAIATQTGWWYLAGILDV
jgi:transposase InsO family protein